MFILPTFFSNTFQLFPTYSNSSGNLAVPFLSLEDCLSRALHSLLIWCVCSLDLLCSWNLRTSFYNYEGIYWTHSFIKVPISWNSWFYFFWFKFLFWRINLPGFLKKWCLGGKCLHFCISENFFFPYTILIVLFGSVMLGRKWSIWVFLAFKGLTLLSFLFLILLSSMMTLLFWFFVANVYLFGNF